MADTIDFVGLALALLNRADSLVSQWLPAGRREGHEWKARNPVRDDKAIGSFSVNLVTGRWADFADSDAKGGDLISLYAYLQGLNNAQAAQTLMADLGWQASPVQTPAAAPRAPRAAPPAGDAAAPAPARSRPAPTAKRAIVPVPNQAGTPSFKHPARGMPSRRWEYRRDGELLGYVCRFDTSDGGKEILPYTWCVDEGDDRGLQGWRWHQWETPRPLYLPIGMLAADPRSVPVVLVEGEKCADAGHQLLGHEFDFVTWPGGAKAWARAGFDWLRGRAVYLWPDCDAQRKKLTKDERDDGVDPQSKPLLGAEWQPGMQAMVGIGTMLQVELDCAVFMCPVPAPGAVSDGWDIADAIAQGWDAEQVRAFIRGARSFVPPGDTKLQPGAADPAAQGSAGAGDMVNRSWRGELLVGRSGVLAIRENVMVALDGVKRDRVEVPGLEDVAGVIAFNEFTNDVIKLRATPWGTPAGEWAEVDELLMGEYLTRQVGLPSMARATLEESVRMVAYRHRYHPVRDYLRGLEWDGTKRLSTWLRRVCMEKPAEGWDNDDPLQQYLARAGTFYLMGMCARALTPGVKFDYMLILEGDQGIGKSTLFKVLAGEWFADTGLVLGDKDSYQQLQGRWLYEFGELDSFGKAEVTKIKSFIASASDYFRASFDRRARAYPRQVVFGGTTNERHYLTDPTGNRRMWPVTVTRRTVDVELLTAERDQLFAEAMQRLKDGARMYPTRDEENDLFEPQQQTRAVENAIEASIGRFLYDDPIGSTVEQIGTVELLAKIGIGVEKLGPGRYHEKQAAAAMRRLGWAEGGRSNKPGRPRQYLRPLAQPRQTQGNSSEAHDDAPPF